MKETAENLRELCVKILYSFAVKNFTPLCLFKLINP